MRYSIDSDGYRATIELEAKDNLGYHNVPLCRALLQTPTHTHRHTVFGEPMTIELEWDEAKKIPLAKMIINPADPEFKKKLEAAQRAAQRQIGEAITELIRLRESLVMVRSAAAASGEIL